MEESANNSGDDSWAAVEIEGQTEKTLRVVKSVYV